MLESKSWEEPRENWSTSPCPRLPSMLNHRIKTVSGLLPVKPVVSSAQHSEVVITAPYTLISLSFFYPFLWPSAHKHIQFMPLPFFLLYPGTITCSILCVTSAATIVYRHLLQHPCHFVAHFHSHISLY